MATLPTNSYLECLKGRKQTSITHSSQHTVIPAKAGISPQHAVIPAKAGISRSFGFTLIEVLVALAIVSIAMTAVIKAVSQNIRSTEHLQNKTIGMYVGQQILNEARAGLLKLSSDKMNEKTVMLGKAWYWQAEAVDTPNQRIQKIQVNVFTHQPTIQEVPVISMEGYLYHD